LPLASSSDFEAVPHLQWTFTTKLLPLPGKQKGAGSSEPAHLQQNIPRPSIYLFSWVDAQGKELPDR
jgi:hypothetical protein